jgi:hypothetical protein
MERILPPTPWRLIREIFKLSATSWLYLIRGCPIKTLPDFDVFEKLSQGASLVRWGDGETALARGKSISYQKHDPKLSQELKDVVLNPPTNTLVGVSWVVYASLLDRRWNLRLFKIMFSTRVYWAKIYPQIPKETLFVRTELWWDHAEDIPGLISNLSKKRDLVLISPEKFLKLCPSNTALIEISKKDAFENYFAISRFVEDYLMEENSRPYVFLVAAGPTAKAIVNDFASRTQVIDIGHGLNFALEGKGTWSWKSDAERL